jgi:hypothetical protein
MCLDIYSEINISRSINCLRIYDEGRLISMDLENYCKEARIERALLVMPSFNNSCGQQWFCSLVTQSPSVEKY